MLVRLSIGRESGRPRMETSLEGARAPAIDARFSQRKFYVGMLDVD
jgi:hypothetical protein